MYLVLNNHNCNEFPIRTSQEYFQQNKKNLKQKELNFKKKEIKWHFVPELSSNRRVKMNSKM